MKSLVLLSTEAQKLWFENLRSTFEKILDSDLELDENLSKQIEHIKKNLDIIVSKKWRLDTKINQNFNEISCEWVDSVLDLSKKLLKELYWNDSLEEIKEEYKILEEDVEETKILVSKKEKTQADLAEVIREKKKYEYKIKQIELLEAIIKEIEKFRIELLKILKNKQEDQTDTKWEKDNITEKQEAQEEQKTKPIKPKKITKLTIPQTRKKEEQAGIEETETEGSQKPVVVKEKDVESQNEEITENVEQDIATRLAEQGKTSASSVEENNNESWRKIRKPRNLKILWEEAKIKQTLKLHLKEKFLKDEYFSEFLQSYFLENQNNEIFVWELVNIIKDFSESFMEIFIEELLKINLSVRFYKNFKKLVLKENFASEESKIILLEWIENNQIWIWSIEWGDTIIIDEAWDMENIWVIKEETEWHIEGNAIKNEKIQVILSKRRKTFDDYLYLFQFAEDNEEIRAVFKKINRTQINNNPKSDEEKLNFYKKFREFYVKNYDEEKWDLNTIRTIDRQIKKYDETHLITTKESLEDELKFNKNDKIQNINNDAEIQQTKLELKLELENVKLKRLNAELLAQNTILIEKNTQLLRELESLNNEDVLKDKEHEIKALQKELENLLKQIEKLKLEVAKKDKKIQELRQKSKEKSIKIGNLKTQVNNRDKKIEKLLKELKELKGKNNGLWELEIEKVPKERKQTSSKSQKPRDMTPEEIEETQEYLFSWEDPVDGIPLDNTNDEFFEIKAIEEELKQEIQKKPRKEKQDLEEKQKIIIDNLKNKRKRNDGESWYDIWVEKIMDLWEIDFEFAKILISRLLRKTDITFFYRKWFFPDTKEIKEMIYNRFKNEVFLVDANLELFEELTQFMIDNITIWQPTKWILITKYKKDLEKKKK